MPGRCFWNILLLFVLSPLLLAQDEDEAFERPEYPLRFSVNANSWGGSCAPGYGRILAGSRVFLSVFYPKELKKEPPARGWPQGYALEAAVDLPVLAPFVPAPGLAERMDAVPYLDINTRSAKKRLLGESPGEFKGYDWEDLNTKSFALTVPPDLVGRTISFRARYQKGDSTLYSETWGPFPVIAPCDRGDSAAVIASRVYEKGISGDYPGLLVLVDSMLAADFSDASALRHAWQIAEARHEYERAFRYLDVLYVDFGTLGGAWLSTHTNRPRLDRGGPRTPAQQALFQQQREYMLQAKAEYEQQEH